ncbi:TOM7 family-domain-containing protein [Gymnopilus junonius]|uniref:TOM7 family-domain-containing protein n=1 Tax=Gymnopilus junonius TaxID=109634 RepID=A0A9P5P520_GYMJU|nr:TOM7 family-domain-containing protein [Gymnopilus junonius]
MPSEETKERISKVIEVGRTVLHYGWIPLIIYVGFTRSNPQPSLIKYVFPILLFLFFALTVSFRLISPLA